ncbi:hypothetical protein FGB62_397g05 [Gracilaria domingensis]|nr:hypothetical protein FGB62_397g05 [Gracilaria domingensis]
MFGLRDRIPQLYLTSRTGSGAQQPVRRRSLATIKKRRSRNTLQRRKFVASGAKKVELRSFIVDHKNGDHESRDSISGHVEELFRVSFRTRSTRELWSSHVDTLKSEKDFFTSKEAKLQGTSKVGRGVTVYEGIGVTLANCLGLKRVYEEYYRARELMLRSQGHAGEEFNKVTITVSQ